MAMLEPEEMKKRILALKERQMLESQDRRKALAKATGCYAEDLTYQSLRQMRNSAIAAKSGRNEKLTATIDGNMERLVNALTPGKKMGGPAPTA